MKIQLSYDIQSYIMQNGNVADKLRLISAGYDFPKENTNAALKEIDSIQNRDGGLPFDFIRGNPSSVKLTAEILPLIFDIGTEYPDIIDGLVSFLISRQKKDGGFAEALNLDPHIEDKYGTTSGREWYPVGKSITWLTGKALEALCLAKYSDEERLRRARDFLMYSQNEDGHWPDFPDQGESDPLGTGNILPSLRAVNVSSDHKVYRDGRAAVLQHLVMSLENESPYDMVDLLSVGKPLDEKERDVISRGLELIHSSQNEDGGWAELGSKKSDPELSSILAFVIKKCSQY
ncbi:MAG: terpene cyclase/mutase family protein [Candidatus Thorarchaeota archaeon]|nr:terpene cyclase/mutase family protein [Candidatus Thorarchaeota archaeon]